MSKRARKICGTCGAPSLPGLIAGVGLCQYHYNVRQFGQAWADHCRATAGDPPVADAPAPEPVHPEADPDHAACAYCGTDLWLQEDTWVDSTDGDCCPGNGYGDNENGVHIPERRA